MGNRASYHSLETEVRVKRLSRIGGFCALVCVAFWLTEFVAIIFMGPPPTAIDDWFGLFRDRGLLGLLDSYLLDAAALVALVPVFLALFAALRRQAVSLMAIATVFALIGIALWISTNPALAMLSLSKQYDAATTEAQRSTFMAAAQTLLTMQDGVGAYFGYLLFAAGGLFASFAMFRGKTFNRMTAWVGILANSCQIVEPPGAAVSAGFYKAFGPGVILIGLSGLFFLAWHLLIGLRLIRMGRTSLEGAI